MRAVYPDNVEAGRVTGGPFSSEHGNREGAFFLVYRKNIKHPVLLRVIASNGGGWEHVSVSPAELMRTPTWEEMHWVKQQFFEPEETVMQLHPPQSQYRNLLPFCLHLWRPLGHSLPLPPGIMVAPDEVSL